jgi:hypothetical protein
MNNLTIIETIHGDEVTDGHRLCLVTGDGAPRFMVQQLVEGRFWEAVEGDAALIWAHIKEEEFNAQAYGD